MVDAKDACEEHDFQQRFRKQRKAMRVLNKMGFGLSGAEEQQAACWIGVSAIEDSIRDDVRLASNLGYLLVMWEEGA